MRMLGSTWTSNVIWYLREGERCFSELQHDVAGISAKMLANRLRKLESNGVIGRITKQTSPPTVWYELTPVGRELSQALVNVINVTQRLKSKEVSR
jgi:DNA-binding HxlR family transcriptional regulator